MTNIMHAKYQTPKLHTKNIEPLKKKKFEKIFQLH